MESTKKKKDDIIRITTRALTNNTYCAVASFYNRGYAYIQEYKGMKNGNSMKEETLKKAVNDFKSTVNCIMHQFTLLDSCFNGKRINDNQAPENTESENTTAENVESDTTLAKQIEENEINNIDINDSKLNVKKLKNEKHMNITIKLQIAKQKLLYLLILFKLNKFIEFDFDEFAQNIKNDIKMLKDLIQSEDKMNLNKLIEIEYAEEKINEDLKKLKNENMTGLLQQPNKELMFFPYTLYKLANDYSTNDFLAQECRHFHEEGLVNMYDVRIKNTRSLIIAVGLTAFQVTIGAALLFFLTELLAIIALGLLIEGVIDIAMSVYSYRKGKFKIRSWIIGKVFSLFLSVIGSCAEFGLVSKLGMANCTNSLITKISRLSIASGLRTALTQSIVRLLLTFLKHLPKKLGKSFKIERGTRKCISEIMNSELKKIENSKSGNRNEFDGQTSKNLSPDARNLIDELSQVNAIGCYEKHAEFLSKALEQPIHIVLEDDSMRTYGVQYVGTVEAKGKETITLMFNTTNNLYSIVNDEDQTPCLFDAVSRILEPNSNRIEYKMVLRLETIAKMCENPLDLEEVAKRFKCPRIAKASKDAYEMRMKKYLHKINKFKGRKGAITHNNPSPRVASSTVRHHPSLRL